MLFDEEKGPQIHPRRMECVSKFLNPCLACHLRSHCWATRIHMRGNTSSRVHECSSAKLSSNSFTEFWINLFIAFEYFFPFVVVIFHQFALIICRNGVALLLALQMGHIPIRSLAFFAAMPSGPKVFREFYLFLGLVHRNQ